MFRRKQQAPFAEESRNHRGVTIARYRVPQAREIKITIADNADIGNTQRQVIEQIFDLLAKALSGPTR